MENYFYFLQNHCIKHTVDVEETLTSNLDSTEEERKKQLKEIKKEKNGSVKENCPKERHVLSFQSSEKLKALVC